MLFHMSLYRGSEFLFKAVALKITVVLWRGREVPFMVPSGLKGRLPGLGDAMLMEIKEPLFLLTLQLMNNRWLNIW